MADINFPKQQLSYKSKGKEWRESHLKWANNKSYYNDAYTRSTVRNKKINYDLINGIIHMEDVERIIDPDCISFGKYTPKQKEIQHYPIINARINLLAGEYDARIFDYRVTVTNPTAISELEARKKQELQARLQEELQNTSQTDEEFMAKMEKHNEYYTYEWQDARELRSSLLLKHYYKEQNFNNIFSQGFRQDALVVGETIFMCDIVSGEPILERINPLKLRAYKAGFSSRIEDADVIVIEDYWSPGKVYDTYYEYLTPAMVKKLEEYELNNTTAVTDDMGNIDERQGFITEPHMIDDTLSYMKDGEVYYWNPANLFDAPVDSLSPYDMRGNIKVLRMFWRSRRKIKKVKSYNPQTGEETFNFFTEDYIIDENKGEEETIYWINEAWEGTLIGKDIYVKIRPRPVQYNRISNPSACHFGIIGQVFNTNEGKPFTLVDMFKPYSYLYDVIHARLNLALSRSWGKMVMLDESKRPSSWSFDKWLYYGKEMGLIVVNSFEEGQEGAAKGKLAGALNNNTNNVIDATQAEAIQQYIQLLQYIKSEVQDVSGITDQRLGQISNRETVGGVERSVLQSSHVTEWIFTMYDDLKKRVLECFIETAKIALKGKNKKFQYILDDGSRKIVDIDGDEFAECDYGIVIDYSNESQQLSQKLDSLADRALQSQMLDFSAILKMYKTASTAEKIKIIENGEKAVQQRQQEQQQQAEELQQQQIQAQQEQQAMQIQHDNEIHQMDNEAKLMVAMIGHSDTQPEGEDIDSMDRAKLSEQMREFNERLELDMKRYQLEREKHKDNQKIEQEKLKITRNKNNNK
ncbi:MAG: hypothetical protein J6N78_00400 [Clostridia bacterium]|nr:hypothetical protein [Clostridia bacterium]